MINQKQITPHSLSEAKRLEAQGGLSKAELAATQAYRDHYVKYFNSVKSATHANTALYFFQYGCDWFLEQAEQLAVKPEANSTTQFEPFVYIKDLKGLIK